MRNLKELRTKQKISQFHLSRLTGIGRSKLQLAENGYAELSAEEIKKIKDALNPSHCPTCGKPK